MILLTAPSKTQLLPTDNTPAFEYFTFPQLLEKSKQLIAELKLLSRKELATLMKTSEKLTETTYCRIQQFTTPFHLQNAAHAIRCFQGDAYDAITAESYNKEELQYAQEHLIILSGLYGLLRPLDLMQPYRLEMGLKFSPLGMKSLYEFWQKDVTNTLLSQLSTADDTTIVNLASLEYAKAISKKQLAASNCRMVEIIFQQPHAKGKDGYKTIPIYSKRARGLMIHFAITNRVNKAKDLLDFTSDGYSFVEQLSSADHWLFRKG